MGIYKFTIDNVRSIIHTLKKLVFFRKKNKCSVAIYKN